MRLFYFFAFLSFIGCKTLQNSSALKIKITPTQKLDSSMRAVTIKDSVIYIAGSNGLIAKSIYGKNYDSIQIKTSTGIPHFRSVAHNGTSIFALSIESPAYLYKIKDDLSTYELVYFEEGKTVFYDALQFLDSKIGFAMGDPVDGCLSVIKTIDGGENWVKISCKKLPKVIEGEAAFAASNGNIALVDSTVYIVTGGKKSRVFKSSNLGETWSVLETPIIEGRQMTGIYATDFYTKKIGFIIGGDWNSKEQNHGNLARTKDGGKTWELLAENQEPDYRSSIQFAPNSNGKTLFAVGIPGISYSVNQGKNWVKISDDSYYSIRFFTSKKAVLVGNKKTALLTLE